MFRACGRSGAAEVSMVWRNSVTFVALSPSRLACARCCEATDSALRALSRSLSSAGGGVRAGSRVGGEQGPPRGAPDGRGREGGAARRGNAWPAQRLSNDEPGPVPLPLDRPPGQPSLNIAPEIPRAGVPPL